MINSTVVISTGYIEIDSVQKNHTMRIAIHKAKKMRTPNKDMRQVYKGEIEEKLAKASLRRLNSVHYAFTDFSRQ